MVKRLIPPGTARIFSRGHGPKSTTHKWKASLTTPTWALGPVPDSTIRVELHHQDSRHKRQWSSRSHCMLLEWASAGSHLSNQKVGCTLPWAKASNRIRFSTQEACDSTFAMVWEEDRKTLSHRRLMYRVRSRICHPSTITKGEESRSSDTLIWHGSTSSRVLTDQVRLPLSIYGKEWKDTS